LSVEFKVSEAAKPQRGFWTALEDLKIERSWIIAPLKGKSYPMHGVRVASLKEFIESPDNNDLFLPSAL